MQGFPPGRFYDGLADTYHLMFPDWDTSMARQAGALDGLIRDRLGPGSRAVLDCACGIGTQAIGLAALGHRVTGSDLSPVAAARAARESAARGTPILVAAADMRALPFRAECFEVVVCADNALPHLLAPADVLAALTEMRRVLTSGGLLLVSTRPYDEIRATRPLSTPPQVSEVAGGRVVVFQLWHWHPDGERYDLEYFQLLPDAGGWQVRVHRASYWALTRQELVDLALRAGFHRAEWYQPAETGFFQPLLVAQ